jgi:hypothetical protein
MTANTRGWWRRTKANESDVDPWPVEFLSRLNLEVEAIRRKNRREVRPERRRLLRKAES